MVPQYRIECPPIRHLIELTVVGAVQSVGKSRVFHRGFSKLLLKPASFQGFNRSGTLHSASGAPLSPTTNPEYPLLKEGKARSAGVVLKEPRSAPTKERFARVSGGSASLGNHPDSLREPPLLQKEGSLSRPQGLTIHSEVL